MVSKVAVIALVAIVAVPIMLGYAFNLTETTKTTYTDGVETNVTEYITRGTYYSYTDMNVYEMNTRNFARDDSTPVLKQFSDPLRSLPIYQTTTSRTALPLDVTDTPVDIDLTGYTFYQLMTEVDYDNLADLQLGAKFQYASDGTWTGQYNRINFISWDSSTGNAYVIAHVNTGNPYYTNIVGVNAIKFFFNNFNADSVITATPNTGAATYADLVAGYKLFEDAAPAGYYSMANNWWVPSSSVKSALVTVDLSTMTDSLTFNTLTDANVNTTVTLDRVSDGIGDVHWYLDSTELVFDNTASENVYQVLFTNEGINVYYTGSWPTSLGLANYYRTWEYEWTTPIAYNDHFKGIQLVTDGDYPKMRVDQAKGLASVFDAIVDQTYDPAQLTGSNNISTTIKSVSLYGDSLTFGGQTYNVKNGSLELGTHNVSLFNLKFESIVNVGGQYDNKINGNTISTTADPSTLTFNGAWVANVVSAPLVTKTVTGTEWISGEFAWDGIDSNFLMVGLLTSLGIFIALGVYSRRSKASVWPLMLVAGGAAFLFLIMM